MFYFKLNWNKQLIWDEWIVPFDILHHTSCLLLLPIPFPDFPDPGDEGHKLRAALVMRTVKGGTWRQEERVTSRKGTELKAHSQKRILFLFLLQTFYTALVLSLRVSFSQMITIFTQYIFWVSNVRTEARSSSVLNSNKYLRVVLSTWKRLQTEFWKTSP